MVIGNYLLVCSGILLSAAAQISLKIAAMNQLRDFRWLTFILCSIIFYALAFFLYSQILKHFPISIIAPVMTIGTVIFVIVGGMVMGETLTTRQISGLVFGVVSILLLVT